MQPISLLLALIALFLIPALLPTDTLRLVAKLSRRQRARITQREGRTVWQQFYRDRVRLARKLGVSSKQFQQFLLKRQAVIIDEIGGDIATKTLGEPSLAERYF